MFKTIRKALKSSGEGGLLLEAFKNDTQDPIRMNFSPSGRELLHRMAVHILADTLDKRDESLVLVVDKGIYLVASILGDGMEPVDGVARPRGTVEYQVSDGPPGSRSTSFDFYHLEEALDCMEEIRERGWSRKKA